jgi:hypothetical protein
MHRNSYIVFQQGEHVKSGKIPGYKQLGQSEVELSSLNSNIGICSNSIQQKHFEEWISSAVDPQIVKLNVRSLEGDAIYDYLIYSEEVDRRNDGRLVDWILKKYRLLEAGGWWVSGVDPLDNYKPMLWGQFKSDVPRLGKEGKAVKYETPPKVATRVVLLRVPLSVWRLASEVSGVELPQKIEVSPEGEAVGFWRWVVEKNVPVTLTEGAKKAGALLTAGYAAIALPGVFNGFRTDKTNPEEIVRRLAPDLKVFATEGRQVSICFDFDKKPKTVENVNSAISNTGGIFNKERCQVRVVCLPGPQKGVDDYLAAVGAEAYRELFKTAPSIQQWGYKQYLRLTHPVNVEVNQRYLSLALPESGLVCVKSPKGTGKTRSLKAIVKRANGEGRKVLIITHRIQLGRSICNSIGIEWIDESSLKSEEKKYNGLGLCFDSLHKLSPIEFEGAIVILDEVEQLTWHALNSSTCAENRVALLDNFRTIVKNAELVIAQDADLSNTSVDYLKKVTGTEPWIAVNIWKPEDKAQFRFVESPDPSPVVRGIEEELSAGGKVLLCTDARKVESKWSSTNLESYFKAQFPNLRILRIDSDSVSDPCHPAFGCIKTLDEVLKRYDLVICTSTLGTGVSIDMKSHFTLNAGIFQGAITPEEVRQFLWRLREAVPRLVWVKKYKSIGRIGDGSIFAPSILRSQNREFKLHLLMLREVDFSLGVMFERENGAFDAINQKTWAEMAAKINCGGIDYRDNVIYGVEEEGHSVTVEAEEKDQAISDRVKEIKVGNHESYARSVEEAEEIDEDHYCELKDANSASQTEKHQIRKFELAEKYGVEVSAELVLKDDSKWYPQLRLHYFLTHDREFVELRDKRHLESHLLRGKGRLCPQDVRLLSGQVDFLKKLEILNLIQPDRELRGTDADVQKILAILVSHSRDVKALLNLTVTKDFAQKKPMQVLKMLLGKLGIGLECVGRERVNFSDQENCANPGYIDLNKQSVGTEQVGTVRQTQIRVYKTVVPEDGRQEIFQVWEKRDQEAVQREAERKERQAEREQAEIAAQTPSTAFQIGSVVVAHYWDGQGAEAEVLELPEAGSDYYLCLDLKTQKRFVSNNLRLCELAAA